MGVGNRKTSRGRAEHRDLEIEVGPGVSGKSRRGHKGRGARQENAREDRAAFQEDLPHAFFEWLCAPGLSCD